MGPFKPLIDVENCTASFVGDGDYHTIQTHGDDVGKFVAASLNSDKWSEVSRMAGDRKTVNEIIALAEAVRGMSVLFHCNPTKVDRVFGRQEIRRYAPHSRRGEESARPEPAVSRREHRQTRHTRRQAIAREVGFADANLKGSITQHIRHEKSLSAWRMRIRS